jgi:hypothetical protein
MSHRANPKFYARLKAAELTDPRAFTRGFAEMLLPKGVFQVPPTTGRKQE